MSKENRASDERTALEAIERIIRENIVENDGPNRMKIGDDWHIGPVVDTTFRMLRGLQEIAANGLRSKPVAGVEVKPFMFGVREADGSPYFEEICVSAHPEELEDAAHDIGGEVVALYAAPQPEAVITEEMVERAAEVLRKYGMDQGSQTAARLAVNAALQES